ncbi:ER-golgi trafficking TRAPP I complex 85 kDa subunit-domain-containing protein [Lipomyces oligophaga]|uniref:ER-golgi trafficking TRAPP I complex 85 kDa subunit-domain-containing protein n=1 Tax=Lipomyces oligophaga TaxID=45792 RepID=UPI0034CD6245
MSSPASETSNPRGLSQGLDQADFVGAGSPRSKQATTGPPSIASTPSTPVAQITSSNSSPAPSISLSVSSFLTGHSTVPTGPLSPNNASAPNNLSSVASLIARSFAPRIAVFASTDADEFASEKGFSSILELLKPFGDTVSGTVTVHGSQGIPTQLDDFGLRFVSSDFMTTSKSSLPAHSAGVLHSSSTLSPISTTASSPVSPRRRSRSNSRTSTFTAPVPIPAGSGLDCFDIDDIDSLLNLYLAQNPRFFAMSSNGTSPSPLSPQALHETIYSKCFQKMLASPPVSAHETFSHPVAAVIFISSRNPQPIETLSMLYREGNDVQLPAYISKDYLRYYVLVHDEDQSELDKSQALFERMKRHFGIHCHMVRLRSKMATMGSATDDLSEPIIPFYHSEWISASEEIGMLRALNTDQKYIFESDASNLRTFIRDMTVQSLVPFMERCINTWNDQIASSRRGLAGRFFSASRRFLSSNSRPANSSGPGGTSSVSGNYDSTTGSYSFHTAEAQMRKLADYAFMIRDWKLAQSTYDILRKDFLNDKAWMYHAGAQEMAAASLILSGVPLSSKARTETLEPLLDSATYSYISRCALPTYALRTIMVTSELLRSRGGGAADDAARWLMKAVSEKLMGNLAHALVIERVSTCYAIRRGIGSQGWGNRMRKAAFWQLVAAKEWVALDKKQHAMQCLDEAGETVYDNLDWTMKPGSLMYDLRQSTQSMVMYDSAE